MILDFSWRLLSLQFSGKYKQVVVSSGDTWWLASYVGRSCEELWPGCSRQGDKSHENSDIDKVVVKVQVHVKLNLRTFT